MEYDSKYKLPANAGAVEVANSLVSDRYIQLTPAFTGGKAMKSGATIPLKRTGAPAELDDIYAALNKLSVALGPSGANQGGKKGALSALLDVSAANLKGNGAALGNSITKLSQAAQTLANSRGDLFGTVRNLQKFTTTLKTSDAQVRLFNRQLAQVAGDLAAERGDLGSALHELGLALDEVNGFIKKNAGQVPHRHPRAALDPGHAGQAEGLAQRDPGRGAGRAGQHRARLRPQPRRASRPAATSPR